VRVETLVQLSDVTKQYEDDQSPAVAHVTADVDLNRAGQTLILVTHDPALAARYAKRVIRIVDGRIAGGVTAVTPS
jgi:predicted ABC-type transport system involved in lysophospholipase L1 biosynthesis ATPase subunit